MTLICACAVIFSRNPVTSAMNMALCFAGTAALLFGMGAQFLGIVQIIVYAGAILVLFLFVVMMLDIRTEEEDNSFYVFRNTDDNTVAVVYKRNNGGYGLIETDGAE